MQKILIPIIILFTTAIMLMACSDDAKQNGNNDNEEDMQTVNGQDNAEESKSSSKTEDKLESASESQQNDANNYNETSSKEKDNQDDKVENKKEEYLKKLGNTKKETDELRNNSKDDITIALKKVEGDNYDTWDGLLNEIYGVLKEQLSSEEMEQLRKEQREWIDLRDNTAKEASLKYEGGTMEQLEYVKTANNLTEKRCFELVEDYMK